MKEIRCWKLEIKGGEYPNSLAARFSTKDEAEKGIPAVGGYGGQVEPETITIYDKAIEWEPALDKAAKASGLAKLSEKEKKALGLV